MDKDWRDCTSNEVLDIEKEKCIAEQAVYGDLIGYHKEGHVCKMDKRYT